MNTATIDFELPKGLECPLPTEMRGISRDEVRLLVTNSSGDVGHDHFYNLDKYLNSGDVLVVNSSGTRPSALPIVLPEHEKGMVHFSTRISAREWLVEIRQVKHNETLRWANGRSGTQFLLPGGAKLYLKKSYYQDRQMINLWVAELRTRLDHDEYLSEYAQPIKYQQLDKPFPLDFYQTMFAFHSGSAEMPSAARAFTPQVMERLHQKGVLIAPILLHTGVSSLEEDEPPYPEYMEIDAVSASVINAAKKDGRNVIAIGTTAIRALESTTNSVGEVVPYKGHTSLYIDTGFEMQVADGMLTGFHEPRASHLKMLESLAGKSCVEQAYDLAIEHGYYWHQFGDLHLILP